MDTQLQYQEQLEPAYAPPVDNETSTPTYTPPVTGGGSNNGGLQVWGSNDISDTDVPNGGKIEPGGYVTQVTNNANGLEIDSKLVINHD